MRGWWLEVERALRAAIAQHPDHEQLLFALTRLLRSVGRNREALPLMDRISELGAPSPNTYFHHINLLWEVDRLEEADRLMEQAAAIYPTHFAVWFTRFYVLMFSGRPSAAIALAEDRQQWPSGIDDAEIERVVRVAKALMSGLPAEVDRVIAEQMEFAHRGSGLAENAIQFASALGRLDTAFAVAAAYYFGRGFDVPELRFSAEQGTYSQIGDRFTGLLFNPATRAMRADPRFGALVAELGLERYWNRAGVRPDFRH